MAKHVALWVSVLCGGCAADQGLPASDPTRPGKADDPNEDTGGATSSASDDGSSDTSGGGSTDPGGESDGSDSGGAEDPFAVTALDRQWLSQAIDKQSADGEFDLGPGPFASVKLVVDIESPCFPLEQWADFPPPPYWPPLCDAYDRLVRVSVDSSAQAPGFELVRGSTPFGAPVLFEEDVTDWANAHPGVHTLRGYISTTVDPAGSSTGSEGGYFMSVRLEVQPGPAPRKVLMAEQVINEDITSASSSRQIPFSVPEGTSYVHISYLTSGHGLVPQSDSACIGGGDEFCQRQHLLAVDDEQIALVTPWRSDCDELCTVTTFDIPLRGTREGCAENPHGTIASVRAPRANWCPASQTFPIEGDLQLQPGEHTFGIDIADIAEGNAWWPTSLWVYAYGD